MDNICPECQNLVTNTQNKHKNKESHSFLTLISTLPNSRLFKCTSCHAYLHSYDQQWEVLIEGYYDRLSNTLAANSHMLAAG
ncbi:hypothetical protein SAMN05421760_11095 [Neptunomonas antarctica]|uniref:Uncharacterized protein n=1 Tax=Neptunomonas antarctica TaxID=619304 RepID=A0A1N7NNG5_9GAMM|nr:hypothetical protein SAMN05421760_11095 [Neptunomonas antarctica]